MSIEEPVPGWHWMLVGCAQAWPDEQARSDVQFLPHGCLLSGQWTVWVWLWCHAEMPGLEYSTETRTPDLSLSFWFTESWIFLGLIWLLIGIGQAKTQIYKILWFHICFYDIPRAFWGHWEFKKKRCRSVYFLFSIMQLHMAVLHLLEYLHNSEGHLLASWIPSVVWIRTFDSFLFGEH